MKHTHISYTGDGVDWHESEEKAIERLGEAIADARADAIQAGEWPCDCDEWFVAKITHRVEAEVTGCGTDYLLEHRHSIDKW